jgi:hypothetical protein
MVVAVRATHPVRASRHRYSKQPRNNLAQTVTATQTTTETTTVVVTETIPTHNNLTTDLHAAQSRAG